MRIVGILGSPRRGGNCEILLDRSLEGASAAGADVDKIVLNELSFRPCQECGGCDKTGVCVIKDGMEGVYKLLRDADAIILAAPIFFAGVSAQAKMMIDRFQCAWVAKYVLKKDLRSQKRKGASISVAGSYRKDHFENSKSVIKAFFATLDTEYTSELVCGGVEKKADVDNDTGLLLKAFELGKGLVAR